MNATQTKYARERASAILNAKRVTINKRYEVKPFTNLEKIEAIRDGKFSIITDKSKVLTWNPSWSDFVIFNEETKVDTVSRDKELSDTQDEYNKIVDLLVLGDAEEAIELLKAFEN